MNKDNGGPAFPFHRTIGAPAAGGMTLRDYFASQAIPALISRHRADISWDLIAPTAYKIADAMLEVRGE